MVVTDFTISTKATALVVGFFSMVQDAESPGAMINPLAALASPSIGEHVPEHRSAASPPVHFLVLATMVSQSKVLR